MKRFFARHRQTIMVVAIVLAVVLVVGLIVGMTNIVSKMSNSDPFGVREPNKDNLLKAELYSALDGTKENGIKISVDDNGVITLNGTAEEDTVIDLVSYEGSEKIALPRSGFFYLSGCLDGSLETYYLYASDSEKGVDLAYNFNDSTVGVVKPEGVEVSSLLENVTEIHLGVVKGTELNNVKIYPTLGDGEKVSFYK